MSTNGHQGCFTKRHTARKSCMVRKRRSVKSRTANHFKDFLEVQIPALENVEELAKKYRGMYKLNLNCATTGSVLNGRRSLPNLCAKTKKLEELLLGWEEDMNGKSLHEPIIRVENLVDDCPPPAGFNFVIENIVSDPVKPFFDQDYLIGCECIRCSPGTCTCPKDSGAHFAYDRKKKMLLKHGSPIFECNKKCKCPKGCPNRVLQQGRTVKVIIFRTSDGRGWGVKTMEFIPMKQFVVEYVGEIITSDEAERRGKVYDAMQQTYLFDLDFVEDDATFTIDAYRYGNISHFINHSCDPNLQVYSVFVDTLDSRLPRIGLFATRDIYPGEELTFDYLMTADDGQEASPITPSKHRHSPGIPNHVNRLLCACGASNCRKYLF